VTTTPMTTTTATKQYQDTQVDVKHVLCALWTVMLFVFAYVDIFGLYRADVLDAALDGKMAATPFTVDQMFLTFTLIYILPPILMVVVTLLARPRVNRIVNIVVSPLYMISIIVSCVGETWVYYFVGSLIEVLLLAAIVRVAWKWPLAKAGSSADRHVTT
jgi:hypothetical protein